MALQFMLRIEMPCWLGDILSVDHIVPRAVCPELDNVIANLELMPLKMNQGKGDGIGQRQMDLARKLKDAGFVGNAQQGAGYGQVGCSGHRV